MAKKHYTDQERYEYCRRYKVSVITITEFCKINNVDPRKYLEFVLNNLDKPVSSLTPYNIKL